MPPKARAGRKGSIAAKDAGKDGKSAAAAMPPPPDPLPPPRILEPEVKALSGCLKNAVVKTGQIYSFYSDTHKLGIQRYAPQPPRSLIASLGHEVERFDQLCDTVESHLLRAIAVLERDLAIEEKRIQDAKTAAISSRTRSKSISSPSSSRVPLPLVPVSSLQTIDATSQPSVGDVSTPTIPASISLRRPSSISLSSLQRPPLPLKIDLPSAALHMSSEEVALFTSGLSSPVTLAPRSARPLAPDELPPELMAAFGGATSDSESVNRALEIDLTVPDTPTLTAQNGVEMSIDPALGSSVDKPIELDLDSMDIDMTMTDLFGDAVGSQGNAAVDGLFAPQTASPMSGVVTQGKDDKTVEGLGIQIFDALSAVAGNSGAEDVFASLGQNSRQNISVSESLPPSQSLDVPTAPSSSTRPITTPSPGSLLASLQSAAIATDPLASAEGNGSTHDPFNFDLGFFTHDGGSETVSLMDELFNMGDIDPVTGEEGMNPV